MWPPYECEWTFGEDDACSDGHGAAASEFDAEFDDQLGFMGYDGMFDGDAVEHPDWLPGIPQILTERQLAEWLTLSLSRLYWFTRNLRRDDVWHYNRYSIPKRRGGTRVILAPKRELKSLQRNVLHRILASAVAAQVSKSAHGFIHGRSTITNASKHMGKEVVMRLDIKDFFPSIHDHRVAQVFAGMGYPPRVARRLARLCTEYDRLPITEGGVNYFDAGGSRHLPTGAPTSPALANLCAAELDRRLEIVAVRHGFTYTRYADDLTLSGSLTMPDSHSERVGYLMAGIQRAVAKSGFELNHAKVHVARSWRRQMVTGLVVNQQVATPREYRHRLRGILHAAKYTGFEAKNRNGIPNFENHLQGMIAYVNATQPEHARHLRAQFAEVQSLWPRDQSVQYPTPNSQSVESDEDWDDIPF